MRDQRRIGRITRRDQSFPGYHGFDAECCVSLKLFAALYQCRQALYVGCRLQPWESSGEAFQEIEALA
jgi:hypothetical protein